MATSAAATAVAVAVNLATEWKRSPLAWAGVVIATAVVFVCALSWPSSASGASQSDGKRRSVVSSSRERGPRKADTQIRKSEVEGVVLEDLHELPDGTVRVLRAYTEESARFIVELRRLESSAPDRSGQ